MYSIVAALPLLSAVLASQYVVWDGVGIPNPNLWNRTCYDDDESLLVNSRDPRCPMRNNTTSAKPIIKAGPPPYGPWTEVSDCIHPAADESNIFCVFTSSNFSSNRGISVFTTPALAEHISQLTPFTTPDVLEGANVASTPRYNVQPLPGRGLGVIANSTMFRGDRVMSYTPVLIVHRKTLEVFQDAERFPFQTLAVERLPPQTRELFHSMHAQFGEDRVEDIINTNSFQVELGANDEPHAALVPETAVGLILWLGCP